MAQKSKKDHIAEIALPLFLGNGIKGTSVDMVVKASEVSKPTVYNHFPDKATLLTHVVECWLKQQQSPTLTADTLDGLFEQISTDWLTSQAVALYGLFMGEGLRAPEAKDLFKARYDLPWREQLNTWAVQHQHNAEAINAWVSHSIVTQRL